MKPIIASLFMLVYATTTLCVAQSYNCNLYGENYTYIRFDVERENNYPILFSAVTKADSINVDISNLDTFVESVYSSCDFTPLSDAAFIKAFQLVYGSSPQIYNWQRQFMIDFFSRVDQFKRRTILELNSGEKIHIEYTDVTGIFLKGDKSFLTESEFSVGLPDDLMTMSVVIIPVALTDYGTSEDKVLFYGARKEQKP